jgi:hypothetical protein
MSDIFISHVEEDSEVAFQIALGLEGAGYSTWCYELDSSPELSYLLQAGQAIEQSKAFVVVISSHSLASQKITQEVVRAHESGKVLVPVLEDITHQEFQERQPEWREAMGAATSIRIPQEGVAAIIDRIISGLKTLAVNPSSKPHPARIDRLSRALSELRPGGMLAKGVDLAYPARPVEKTRGRGISRRKLLTLSAVLVVALVVMMVVFFVNGSGSKPTHQTSTNPMPTLTVGTTVTPAPDVITVSIEAPKMADVGSDFVVRVNVASVVNLTSYQFDVSYDPTFLEVIGEEGLGVGVMSGVINDITIPVQWEFLPSGEQGKIHMVGEVGRGIDVSGAGYLAQIHFHVVGVPLNSNFIALLDGRLSDVTGKELTPVTWQNAAVGVPGESVVEAVTHGFSALYGTRGIAWDGTNLWLAGSYSGISKMDTNGEILGNYSAPAPAPMDLTMDGTTLWVFCWGSDRIYHFAIDESGGVPQTITISSFEAPKSEENGGINRGLAWDGSNLWYSDRYNVYRLDTSGNVLSSFEFPYEVGALAWDGEHLWLALNKNPPEVATLVKVDAEGHSLFVLNAINARILDLSWGDGYMWVVGNPSQADLLGFSETSMIYKIEWRTIAIGMQN